MNFSGATSPGKTPCPHATIACQELLNAGDVNYSGMLMKPLTRCRKGSFICPLLEKLPWIHRYVVLSKGSVYLYGDSVAKKPNSAYSLYGYHQVVRAGDIAVKKYPWTFKIVNLANPDRCKYFAAGCEREMKAWMREIRSQLIIANAELLSIAKIDVPHAVDDSEVQSSIYGDSAQNVASFSVEGRRSSSNSFSSEYPEEESDDSDDYDKIDETELVRPLPPVPKNNGTASSSAAGMASTNNASCTLPKAQPRPPPRRISARYESTEEAVVPKLKSPPQVKPKPLLDKPRPPARLPSVEPGQVPLPPSRNKVPSPPAKKEEMFKMNDVCWYGSDKQAADQIIRNIGKEGVFMVRQSDNPLCVKTLVCFVDGRPVKFMIKQNPTSGMYYIHDEYTFPSIPALLEHYHHNNLPKKITCLTEPHTKYTTE